MGHRPNVCFTKKQRYGFPGLSSLIGPPEQHASDHLEEKVRQPHNQMG